jgi:hypothetical protein
MNFDTLNDVSMEVENSCDLRILHCRPKIRKKHEGRKKKCKKCHEATWANAHLAIGMKRLKASLVRKEISMRRRGSGVEIG